MKKLMLVEHTVPTTIRRDGYTVRPGNFYGILVEEGRKYPAFWSGWISAHCVALHVRRDGVDSMQWVDESDLDAWSIVTARDFWAPYLSELDAVNRAEYGCLPNGGDYIPFFQQGA